jgi:hypothetical protein
VDNRTAVYSATKTIEVDRGVFLWANADAIVAADIGKLVYVTDDQTVNKTGGGQNIIAGSIVDVDTLGVWVDTAKIGPIGATTPSSLTVAANASVGGTLAVTGNQSNTANLTVGGTLGATGATTLSSTLAVTGQATLTAIPKFGATLGTPGAVTFVVTNAPTGASTIPKWIKVMDANGYTNYVPCLQY